MQRDRLIRYLLCITMISVLITACSGSSDDEPVTANTVTIPVGVMSMGKDVVIGSSTGTGFNTSGLSFAFFVRKGDSYTSDDLSGTWYYKEFWASTTDRTGVSVDEFSTVDLATDMSAAIDSDGNVTLVPGDGSTVHAYMGASRDIIVAAGYDTDGDSDGEPDGVSVGVFIKIGSDYNYDPDLLGNWYEESLCHSNPAEPYAIVNEKGQLVFGAGNTFSGDFIEYPDETTYTVSGGTATLVGSTVTVTGESTIGGIMSAGKDVFTAVDDSDEVGMLVALRQGDSYSLSEFEGAWYGAIVSLASDGSDYWAESQWETITYEGSDQDVTVDWGDSDGHSGTETYSDYELTISDEGLISIIVDLEDGGSSSGPL